MKKRNIFKPTLYLFMRLCLVGVLCFMTSPLSTRNEALFNPIFSVFYYFVLMYLFVYTMWYEGCQDRIHVNSATRPSADMPYKGFLCSGILAAIQIVIYFLPRLFSLFSVNALSVVATVARTVGLMPYIYPISLISTRSLGSVASGVLQSQTEYVWTTVIFILLVLSTVVGAGIGYLAGYRDVKILKPYLDKWHRE